jgi:fatty-acyl-CoA synthase
MAGGVLVAMNSRLSRSEVEHILKDCGARILLIDAELRELVDGGATPNIATIVIEDTGEDDDPYERLLADGSPDVPEGWVQDESEPISINFTSGTTGKSKGAVYTHRGAYLQAHGVAMEVELGYDSVHLWTLPMFHCNGWCVTWGSRGREGSTYKADRLDQHVTVPTGGSPPTPALLKRMRELNLHPVHLYGLTETYGPIMAAAGSRSGMSAT